MEESSAPTCVPERQKTFVGTGKRVKDKWPLNSELLTASENARSPGFRNKLRV